MAAAMDIRFDYGAWPGDDEATTESNASREASPAVSRAARANEIQRHSTSRPQQASDLSLSDLFSDVGGSVHDQDLLDAETNGASASTSQSTSHKVIPTRRSAGMDLLASPQIYSHDSPVIDLTDSPTQPSIRPTTSSRGRSPQHRLQGQSTVPPTLESHLESRRAPLVSSKRLYTEGRPRKRRRLSETVHAAGQPGLDLNSTQEVEAVDLTEVNNESDMSRAISKQQQDAVQSQMKDAQGEDLPGRTPLSSYKCPICMDTPEDATSTICGHLFCHKCIIDTLRFSEQQRRDDAGNSKARGTCPVCRKPLARKDAPGPGRTLVPLELKLSTKRDLKGKAVVGRQNGQASSVPARMLTKTERESSADMWRDLTNLEHH